MDDRTSRGKPSEEERERLVNDETVSLPEGDEPGPSQILDPADYAVSSAPVVVLREIGRRYTGVYMRPRSLAKVDLVHDDVLTETDAYELIRTMSLGQVLLISPLTLEEIYGIFLMSDNGSSAKHLNSEYIDSWVLTGYCAKQAMLSISFSSIVNKIKNETANLEDQKAVRLWSTISLHHLHWAATTGRPSVIPRDYLDHCNILLSFYDASMQDGMLVAEVSLYASLLSKLEKRQPRKFIASSTYFADWEARWRHLLDLPTALKLKIGQHSASLILIMRSLQELDEGLSPNIFMANHATTSQAFDDAASRTTANSPNTAEKAKADLRVDACVHARVILQTFLKLPTHLKSSLGSNMCLRLVYGALILSHYGETVSNFPDRSAADLVAQVSYWVGQDPSKSWAARFGNLAQQKLLSRLDGSQQPMAGAALADGVTRVTEMLAPDGVARGADPVAHEYEIDWTEMFPNMEDFFAGGFLGYGAEP
ncbi:Transcriptional activator of proteases prtT like protein [Verticillium longisporum]|uniref:Transcriptional activator of proteases prtT like protein n=1 Tax=Verticillium longisporum TaxID=100787 RepID=A0A8I3ALQ6_VERLO|nr:Transcriptional activator of proteases prtT like protein [Verticillium longisporum]